MLNILFFSLVVNYLSTQKAMFRRFCFWKYCKVLYIWLSYDWEKQIPRIPLMKVCCSIPDIYLLAYGLSHFWYLKDIQIIWPVWMKSQTNGFVITYMSHLMLLHILEPLPSIANASKDVSCWLLHHTGFMLFNGPRMRYRVDFIRLICQQTIIYLKLILRL